MAAVLPAVQGSAGALESSGAGAAALIALIIISSAAAYYTGRRYDRTGMIIAVAGIAAALMALFALGSLQFN
jgi:hypothetical protein